jgi:hypothetical protein
MGSQKRKTKSGIFGAMNTDPFYRQMVKVMQETGRESMSN